MRKYLTLICVVLLCGCISMPSYEYSNEISEPYDINPSAVGMRINTTTAVKIVNSGGNTMHVKIDSATIRANYEDGRIKIISGVGGETEIPPDGEADLQVSFNGVPVEYELKSDPLRLHPLIKSYDVDIQYSGKIKLWIIWTPSKQESEHLNIKMNQDIPLEDQFNEITDTFQIE